MTRNTKLPPVPAPELLEPEPWVAEQFRAPTPPKVAGLRPSRERIQALEHEAEALERQVRGLLARCIRAEYLVDLFRHNDDAAKLVCAAYDAHYGEDSIAIGAGTAELDPKSPQAIGARHYLTTMRMSWMWDRGRGG